ncbi:hypothetical protein NX059_005115 [Plenodomus lindquistii]|nr:hypothetical protein NX059_005115 [Plenodomus lindquistii]
MLTEETVPLRAPGDVLLVNRHNNELDTFVPYPVPTNNLNDPLNWSAWRKLLNFALVCGQTVAVFTTLSIQGVFWQQMGPDMQLTFEDLNNSHSANLAGLAVGCIFIIPISKKYGRRSTYVVSTAVMAAVAWWVTHMHSKVELFVTQLLHGLAGAVNECIVQMTIADMFFLDQRGTMNAVYLICVMIGSFLTPMIAGIQATHQGWRKSYLTLAICLTVLSLGFIVGYEESKYVPVFDGSSDEFASSNPHVHGKTDQSNVKDDVQMTMSSPEPVLARNAYLQRLRWTTKTSEPLVKLCYFPAFVVFFPHVLYAALQYACGVTCLILLGAVGSMIFPRPPYLLSPAAIGYLNAGPFIGNVIGSFYTGFLGDRSIRWLAKRNGGYFEPEMRLYLLLPPALLIPAGQIMFGITIQRGMHWIYPSVAGALFAFGLGAISDAAFTLVIDSYQPVRLSFCS